MLSLQTVLPDTLELLKTLMRLPLLGQMRLVGGTALALQYGHRRLLLLIVTIIALCSKQVVLVS